MNVVNVKDIEKVLRRSDRLLSKLLKQALLRPFTRESHVLEELTEYPADPPPWLTRQVYEERKPFYRFVANDLALAIISMAELWLATSIARGERWTRRVDDAGRVPRLRNIQRIEDVLNLCAADMERYRRPEGRAAQDAAGRDPPHVETVLHLLTGLTWVRLCTPAALSWEGTNMRHCLGHDRYAARQRGGEAAYFSLRDARGRPFVTIETAGGTISECRGIANSDPFPHYRSDIDALIDLMGWRRSGAREMAPPPRRRLRAYRAHCDDCEVDVPGDFSLVNRTGDIRLPRVMRVAGSFLAAGNVSLRALPEILDVGGHLRLHGCINLGMAPQWLRVAGDADMARCTALMTLPADMQIGGSLDLTGCASLRRIPARLIVGRTLNISQCWSIPRVPETVQVAETLIRGRMSYVNVRDMNRHISGQGWVAFGRRRI